MDYLYNQMLYCMFADAAAAQTPQAEWERIASEINDREVYEAQ